ncbi:MAG TPA: glycosyltransferase [Bacteroidetes bacterium]|nr:D-inositol 3-phosphate glycosyltransferase [bacterium BMS3Bbin04]HDO66092.1 glycosyltransferase [Bacteroidota bacterium]HEX05217.1 glycosyltransferase [Bacteroidota bacterium]
MKVELIGPLPPLRGGISQYNNSLLLALRKQGHDVLPVSYRVLYPSFMFPGSSQFDQSTNAPDGSLTTLTAWNPLSWKSADARIRQHGATHIIFEHWHPFFVPCLRYLATHSNAQRTTVIAHNVLPHENAGLGKFLNPLLFREADKVIVGASEQLVQLNALLPECKGEVVPHPAYDRFFTGHSDQSALDRHLEARRRLTIPTDIPYFVHLGLVREYKGVDILLQAAAKLTFDYRLDIIGEFYDKPEAYHLLHKELHLGDRVRIEDRYLNDEEMADRILAADAVVLPYRHATQSGVAMAALAGGCPIIASGTGALADLVKEGENGILAQAGDIDSLADAITRFTKPSPSDWRQRREAVSNRTLKQYSWDSLVNRIMETV